MIGLGAAFILLGGYVFRRTKKEKKCGMIK
ncbi:LPXTG cell wall anchor domain-containing protein [Listeria aquatica]|uniref:LPXTG cell wall anchor domain-containing protein n=1 Tax=Listeria aquatica TaxID=1494960 RepID=A0A841ZKZ2_9LIST|nr:LPXTG cell wall anchor domain-containing protein [Listeria aquatica]